MSRTPMGKVGGCAIGKPSTQGNNPLTANLRPFAVHERTDGGKPALDTSLTRHARQPQGSGSERTIVVCDGEHVAGYFGPTVGQVDTAEAPPRVRKGKGGYPNPVVILARLAVSTSFQGRGIGAAILRDAIRRTLAISEQAGIRALLTHPNDDGAARFYQRFGFTPSPLREPQWLLLNDARRLLERA